MNSEQQSNECEGESGAYEPMERKPIWERWPSAIIQTISLIAHRTRIRTKCLVYGHDWLLFEPKYGYKTAKCANCGVTASNNPYKRNIPKHVRGENYNER